MIGEKKLSEVMVGDVVYASLSDAARRNGIKPSTVCNRVNMHGWTVAEAITKKVRDKVQACEIGAIKANRDGYLREKTKHDGWVFQHRLVYAEHLGRDLLRHEEIHHKNGDKTDNRLENLEMWSSSQPSGQRIADKVKWAREILALYGDMA